MAFTYVYGNPVKANSFKFYFKSFLGYEVITNNDTTYTLRLQAGVCVTTTGKVGWDELQVTLASTIAPSVGTVPDTVTGNYRSANATGTDQKIVYVPTINNNNSYVDLTWNKTHSPQTLTLSASLYKHNLASGTKSIATLDLTIPQKTSYNIVYNPNGGTGSSKTETKWYGENYTILSNNAFTRTNYTLSKWNTASGGSGTNYNCGATYSTNAGLTLYAQWTINYTSPTLGSISVYRSDEYGQADDTGTYISINAFTYGGGKVGSTQYKPYIKIEIDGTAKYPATQQSAVSGTFSKTTYGTYVAESTHTVKITIYDTGYTAYQKTYSVTIPTATYPIDLKVNGTKVNMGIMTTAVNDSTKNNLTLMGFTTTGNSTINGTLTATGAITCTGLTISGTRVPKITASTSTPSASDGVNGDVWLVYS